MAMHQIEDYTDLTWLSLNDKGWKRCSKGTLRAIVPFHFQHLFATDIVRCWILRLPMGCGSDGCFVFLRVGRHLDPETAAKASTGNGAG
jgi:hypothetical protein